MLSRYPKDDLEGIPSPIKEHLQACKIGMYRKPYKLGEALDQADEAKRLAIIIGSKDVERRIRFYRAECYRRMGKWKKAYRLYSACAVVTERDERWARDMQSRCGFEIERRRRANAEPRSNAIIHGPVTKTVVEMWRYTGGKR